MIDPRAIVPLGEAGFRFPLPSDVDRAATVARLRALPGVGDVVLAEMHGAVFFASVGLVEAPLAASGDAAPPVAAPAAAAPLGGVLADIAAAVVLGGGAAPAREIAIRVAYDGPDLDRVAAWAGLPAEEVVRIHAAPRYEVRYLGFLPGFAYLAQVPAAIAAPRLPSPRERVPAGAVGIAGARTGIYPFESPGGWNLVGRVVDFVPFDVTRGAALAPGDGVRFVPA